MPLYNIEWSELITRDIGWEQIEAPSKEAARNQYVADHGMRRVCSVIEVNPDHCHHGIDLDTDCMSCIDEVETASRKQR